MKKLLALGAVTLILAAATTAVAGPSDGNRPGPSPAPWLQPKAPSRPYALTGEQPKRTFRDAKPTRHTERLGGGKVVVDVYRR